MNMIFRYIILLRHAPPSMPRLATTIDGVLRATPDIEPSWRCLRQEQAIDYFTRIKRSLSDIAPARLIRHNLSNTWWSPEASRYERIKILLWINIRPIIYIRRNYIAKITADKMFLLHRLNEFPHRCLPFAMALLPSASSLSPQAHHTQLWLIIRFHWYADMDVIIEKLRIYYAPYQLYHNATFHILLSPPTSISLHFFYVCLSFLPISMFILPLIYFTMFW